MWCLWLFFLSTDATHYWLVEITHKIPTLAAWVHWFGFGFRCNRTLCCSFEEWPVVPSQIQNSCPLEVRGATWHACKHEVCYCTIWLVLFPTFWEQCVAYQIRRLVSCAQKLISSGDVDVCTQSLAPYEISVLGGGLSACTDAVHE